LSDCGTDVAKVGHATVVVLGGGRADERAGRTPGQRLTMDMPERCDELNDERE
jgi:hypothetical protein